MLNINILLFLKHEKCQGSALIRNSLTIKNYSKLLIINSLKNE